MTVTAVGETPKPICQGCQKSPDQLEEYIIYAQDYETTPDEFVRTEEGTYNHTNGHFLCTECYIRAGMPVSAAGRWVCP